VGLLLNLVSMHSWITYPSAIQCDISGVRPFGLPYLRVTQTVGIPLDFELDSATSSSFTIFRLREC